jgi:hypothetical protein
MPRNGPGSAGLSTKANAIQDSEANSSSDNEDGCNESASELESDDNEFKDLTNSQLAKLMQNEVSCLISCPEHHSH